MSRSSLLCANPNCGMTLLDPHATRGDASPEVNDLLLCGACRMPSVVTLLGTRLLTDAEFLSMPDDVRRELDFAKRALDAKLSSS